MRYRKHLLKFSMDPTDIYWSTFSSDNCSSMEQSTWQEVLQEEGIRMIPRHRCSIGEGEVRLVLRYSTASWRMMFPCLSMQWKEPKKNRPSLIPTSIRRQSSFLTRLMWFDPFVSDPAELSTWVSVVSTFCSILCASWSNHS